MTIMAQVNVKKFINSSLIIGLTKTQNSAKTLANKPIKIK